MMNIKRLELSIHHSSFRIQRLISNPLPSVVAVFHDGAALADGVAWAAEFASVAYEVDVEGVELSGGDEAVHKDRKSTRLNSSHDQISYAVFCLKKKKTQQRT